MRGEIKSPPGSPVGGIVYRGGRQYINSAMRKKETTERELKAIWDARLKLDPTPFNNVIVVDARELEFINDLPHEGETTLFKYKHRKMDHLHNLTIEKKQEATMKKALPLGAKIVAIQKAIKSGQKFYVQTYVGKAEVVGMANDGHFAWAKGRSWAICSTHINCWYEQVGKEEKTMVDIDKLIKLRDQTVATRKIDYAEQQKYSSESQSYSYRLGKQHGLDEVIAKLDDLIATG